MSRNPFRRRSTEAQMPALNVEITITGRDIAHLSGRDIARSVEAHIAKRPPHHEGG